MRVKFNNIAGGVFIEQKNNEEEYQYNTRCFRFDENDNAEYAFYGELTGNNPAPRWYGHLYKKDDFVFV